MDKKYISEIDFFLETKSVPKNSDLKLSDASKNVEYSNVITDIYKFIPFYDKIGDVSYKKIHLTKKEIITLYENIKNFEEKTYIASYDPYSDNLPF